MDYNNIKTAILGSTGSVGTQAIDALSQFGAEITMLAAGKNHKKLIEQALAVNPRIVATSDETCAEKLREALSHTHIKIYSGEDAVCRAIYDCGASLIVHSISGMAGLPAALAAAETGARIAMANKEALIAAGHLIYNRLEKSGGELIPVDSEHSAIFQCLCAQGAAHPSRQADPSKVRRILLTASGGPFFGWNSEQLDTVTPEMALAHPTWKMGPKITVDCATLMNKGFELIEACRLFGVDSSKVEVLIHIQSIIHSMVEYIDTSVIAQLSYPDMRDCVRFALTYPDRAPAGSPPLDFAKVGTLTFHEPDNEAFPLLNLARETWSRGGTAPASLIAADEEAVDAFLKKKIGFGDIARVVIAAMNKITVYDADSEAPIYRAEQEARCITGDIIKAISK